MKKRKDLSKQEFEQFFEGRPMDLEKIEGSITPEEAMQILNPTPKPTPTPIPDDELQEILRQGMERAKKMRKR